MLGIFNRVVKPKTDITNKKLNANVNTHNCSSYGETVRGTICLPRKDFLIEAFSRIEA